MKQNKSGSEAYQRILTTARDLFYRNGYRATGINEIIEKSGVAKATTCRTFQETGSRIGIAERRSAGKG